MATVSAPMSMSDSRPVSTPGAPGTQHPRVLAWVEEMARLCSPDHVVWCDGSAAEKTRLIEEAIASGVIQRLNQEKLPGCYYHRSNPSDVARVEQCTFICTPTADEAGPTNNWAAPDGMKR